MSWIGRVDLDVDTSGLFAFRARKFPLHPIPSNPNKSILIFFATAKLDVTPAKGRGFTPTHPCAQESEKEQLKISIHCFEK